jgi:hypothetical protein
MNDVQFGIGSAFDNNVIAVDMPALKKWDISAH